MYEEQEYMLRTCLSVLTTLDELDDHRSSVYPRTRSPVAVVVVVTYLERKRCLCRRDQGDLLVMTAQ